MSLLLLLACAGKPDGDLDPDDTGYAWHDTSPVVETGGSTPPETGGETAETGGETGDPGEPPPPAWVGLSLHPATLVVNPGASWTLRAVGTRDDGTRADVTDAVYTVEDPKVLSVAADGTVTALAAGTTTLRAALEDQLATATVEVRDDLALAVTVVDARTGAPIPDARVALAGSPPSRSDADGRVTLTVPDGLPVDVSAWVDEDWSALTVLQTVSRSVVLPLWPRGTLGAAAEVEGTVSFADVPDPAWDELAAGLVGAAWTPSLATLDVDGLFAPDRTLTLYGADVSVPANVVVEGTAEDYAAPAWPGAAGSWCFAGTFPIDEVSGAAGSTGDAFALFIAHLADLRWDGAGGGTTDVGAPATVDLAPATAVGDRYSFGLPALPLGFRGTEETLVLAAEDTANGWLVTGMGLGSTVVAVDRVDPAQVPGALGSAALAYAQVDGLGSGGATSAVVAHADADGAMVFPPMLDVAAVEAWSPKTRALAVSADADAHLLRVRLVDPHRNVHDLVVAGSWSGTLPNTLADFGRAQATLDLLAVQTVDGHYEEWVQGGTIEPGALDVVAAAHTRQE